MQITITGVDYWINRINQYADMDRKLKEIAEKLCKIGEPIIRQIHGHHADSITTEPTANGYVITASGQDVMFIEFGAGDAAGSENGLYEAVPAEARPGSWSEAHGGPYALHKKTTGQGYWFFAGHLYTEVRPSPAFYYAYEYMVQNLPQVAREVFGNG